MTSDSSLMRRSRDRRLRSRDRLRRLRLRSRDRLRLRSRDRERRLRFLSLRDASSSSEKQRGRCHVRAHFTGSHISGMHVCLVVTCHLQNDQDLLRATAVTQRWNGYRNNICTLLCHKFVDPLQGTSAARKLPYPVTDLLKTLFLLLGCTGVKCQQP